MSSISVKQPAVLRTGFSFHCSYLLFKVNMGYKSKLLNTGHVLHIQDAWQICSKGNSPQLKAKVCPLAWSLRRTWTKGGDSIIGDMYMHWAQGIGWTGEDLRGVSTVRKGGPRSTIWSWHNQKRTLVGWERRRNQQNQKLRGQIG